jgi:hypothetical protein
MNGMDSVNEGQLLGNILDDTVKSADWRPKQWLTQNAKPYPVLTKAEEDAHSQRSKTTNPHQATPPWEKEGSRLVNIPANSPVSTMMQYKRPSPGSDKSDGQSPVPSPQQDCTNCPRFAVKL